VEKPQSPNYYWRAIVSPGASLNTCILALKQTHHPAGPGRRPKIELPPHMQGSDLTACIGLQPGPMAVLRVILVNYSNIHGKGCKSGYTLL
jgi:hypothetical protein